MVARIVQNGLCLCDNGRKHRARGMAPRSHLPPISATIQLHDDRISPHILQRTPQILTDLMGQTHCPATRQHRTHRKVKAGRKMATQGDAAALMQDMPACAGHHSGMLSCFFHGIGAFLLRNDAKARLTRLRVERGCITSSMNPRSAATKGLANRSS